MSVCKTCGWTEVRCECSEPHLVNLATQPSKAHREFLVTTDVESDNPQLGTSWEITGQHISLREPGEIHVIEHAALLEAEAKIKDLEALVVQETTEKCIRGMELQAAREVIEFYADKNNWRTRITADCDVDGVIDDSDLQDEYFEAGGKRARQFLTKFPAKEEGE